MKQKSIDTMDEHVEAKTTFIVVVIEVKKMKGDPVVDAIKTLKGVVKVKEATHSFTVKETNDHVINIRKKYV